MEKTIIKRNRLLTVGNYHNEVTLCHYYYQQHLQYKSVVALIKVYLCGLTSVDMTKYLTACEVIFKVLLTSSDDFKISQIYSLWLSVLGKKTYRFNLLDDLNLKM